MRERWHTQGSLQVRATWYNSPRFLHRRETLEEDLGHPFFQLRRQHTLHGQPPPADADVDASVARELETGEFESVDVRDRG